MVSAELGHQRMSAGAQAVSTTTTSTSTTTAMVACLLSNGHLIVFSVPSLRILSDVDAVAGGNSSVSRCCFAFGNLGQAVYMTSPLEMTKITLSADLRSVDSSLIRPCLLNTLIFALPICQKLISMEALVGFGAKEQREQVTSSTATHMTECRRWLSFGCGWHSASFVRTAIARLNRTVKYDCSQHQPVHCFSSLVFTLSATASIRRR